MQEAWLRLDRPESRDSANLRGWRSSVVGRVCLDVLRARKLRREDALKKPEPIQAGASDPEQESLLADAVGSRFLSCSKRSLRPSGSHLSCTICSACPSTRLHPSWADPCQPRNS